MAEVPEYCGWEERLQESIDGDLDPAQSAALDAHMAGCTDCRSRMRALRELDSALRGSLTRQVPSDCFDTQVLRRVAAVAMADRAASRTRIERESAVRLAVLSRQWWGIWRSVVLNIAALFALLVCLWKTLESVPLGSRWADMIGVGAGFLMEYMLTRPEIIVATAAGLGIVLLWLMRSILLPRSGMN